MTKRWRRQSLNPLKGEIAEELRGHEGHLGREKISFELLREQRSY
jgi:hypothetical protein